VLARIDEIEAARLEAGLDDAFALAAGRIRRPEARVRARACIAGMLSGLKRKTGWPLAEHVGEAVPEECSGWSTNPPTTNQLLGVPSDRIWS
jgi:hypothetical protein